VPAAGAVNSISGLTHIAWLSSKQFLGGWYGVEVVVSAAHVNAGAQGEAGGVGATTIAPFILQWPEHRVLGMAIDQRVTVDFDLPTGQYSRASNVNIGDNAFTVHPYYAVSYTHLDVYKRQSSGCLRSQSGRRLCTTGVAAKL